MANDGAYDNMYNYTYVICLPMSSLTLPNTALFSDKIFSSTDLNRRASEVLNCASQRPVTISRNNEQFALLPREQLGGMVATLNAVRVAFETLLEIEAVLTGPAPLRSSFGWLKVYERDDLEKFRHELLSTVGNVTSQEGDFEEIHTLIYEWRESAAAIQGGAVDAGIHVAPAERIEIDRPNGVSPDEPSGRSDV